MLMAFRFHQAKRLYIFNITDYVLLERRRRGGQESVTAWEEFPYRKRLMLDTYVLHQNCTRVVQTPQTWSELHSTFFSDSSWVKTAATA
jgi:hypothetical protein